MDETFIGMKLKQAPPETTSDLTITGTGSNKEKLKAWKGPSLRCTVAVGIDGLAVFINRHYKGIPNEEVFTETERDKEYLLTPWDHLCEEGYALGLAYDALDLPTTPGLWQWVGDMETYRSYEGEWDESWWGKWTLIAGFA